MGGGLGIPAKNRMLNVLFWKAFEYCADVCGVKDIDLLLIISFIPGRNDHVH